MPLRPALLAAFVCLCPLLAVAEDWPQWMGPQRDNVWRESGIIDAFPAEGPRILWRTPVAGGYSGPAVANGRVYLTDYVTDDEVQVDNFNRGSFSGSERVLCLDQATGKVLWKHEYPVTYGISYPSGPRCTPTISEGKVYTLGAEGHLFCFDAMSGAVQWSQNLPQTYNAKTPLWGYAAHPLIDGPQLIVIAGGNGSHAVALNKQTGKEIWRHGNASEQGYSPPSIIEAGGVRQLILLHPSALESVNPETGEAYWSFDYEATNGSVIMTPVHHGNLLYGGGFKQKNILVELDQSTPTAEVLWQDERKMGLSPVNVQPFVEAGTMYGFDEDGALYGVELSSGKRLWKSTAPLQTERPLRTGTAFMVRNGKNVWMFTEQGDLLITRLTSEGYEEIDRAKVIEPTNVAFGRRVVWAAPAWAGGRAYLRNDKECICVELSTR
ncbi:outer membrane protein assembly factor BamB family protein [Roseimaritima ulvae]|uniref:Quinoprotein ethanol dehydrogenase n=1 Tax=Roseimaritima ulvae TaxID=980254 RepID=A0A5B9QZW9_9BACT|nr:PQQ-binding-like beta-propeller repeat protein [Roseimaritima ulvae]QEG43662.1 Quinoprotein ethanol dehydrogenase precursor [Roseimaritima ulvae]